MKQTAPKSLLAAASFARNAAGLLATNAVLVPIQMLIGVVLARFLSVEERGLYSVAGTLAGLLAAVGTFGWPAASIYRLRRTGSPPAEVTSAALVGIVASSTLVLIVCVAFEPWISRRFLNGAPPTLLYLAAALVPCFLTGRVFGSGIARGINRFGIHNLYRVGLRLAELAAFVIALVVFDTGVVGLLAIFLALEASGALLLVASVGSHTGFSGRARWDEITSSLRYGLKSYLQTIADRIHQRIDIFMIAALLRDPEQVAYYTIAGNLVGRLATVPESLAAAAFPQLAASGPAEAARFSARLSRNAVALAIPATLGFAAIAPLLLPFVYGAPYRASIEPFLILIPGMALKTVPRIVARYFMAIDRQKVNIAAQLAALIANVSLNLMWIPRYGILGAAAASLVSYTLEALVIATAFVATTRCSVGELLVVRRSDVTRFREHVRAWRADG